MPLSSYGGIKTNKVIDAEKAKEICLNVVYQPSK